VPTGTPLWLKVVLRAERVVGERVESAVHSDAYFDLATRTRRTSARVTTAVEGVSRRVIHLVNLPAGTDIRRVREQLSRMERRLIELSKEVEELAAEREPEAAPAPGAEPNPAARAEAP
jgi:hypothetical protein